MKKITCVCDHCSEEIEDVLYTLTCYAEDLKRSPLGGYQCGGYGTERQAKYVFHRAAPLPQVQG